MKNHQRFEQMWTDLLEGELDQDGMEELRELISDGQLLRSAADRYEIHRLLGIIEQDTESNHDQFVRQTMASLPVGGGQFVGQVMKTIEPSSARHSASEKLGGRVTKWGLGLAAAAAIIVSSALLFRFGWNANEITIVERSGDVTLTGDGGKFVDNLEVGHRFEGGTLESRSADAWVKLQFADESTITVAGRSILTVSQYEQKSLRLRHGNLSADITPQPTGKPMLINTPTAQLQVLGTQFNVDAKTDSTRLVVNQGLVRIKRLADDDEVDVRANHQVSATAEADSKMQPSLRTDARYSWRADLKNNSTHGKWTSSVDGIAKRLKAAVSAGTLSEEQAYVEFKAAALKEPNGGLWAVPLLHTAARNKNSFKSKGSRKPQALLAIVSMTHNQLAPVIGHPSARLRVRGRVYGACQISFGLTAVNPHGGFGGKYVANRSYETIEKAEGAIDLEIPLTEFGTKEKTYGTSPIDKELVEFWVYAIGKTKIQITEVELLYDDSD